MSITIILLLAFSLSMDAFSLALAYGTLNFSKASKKRLSFTVGVFHFFMPILGMSVKHYLFNVFHISFDIITFIIFIYIGINMILDKHEEKDIVFDMYFKSILLFSFAVSLDSFSIGMTFNQYNFLAPLFFSMFSAIFTYLGLKLGESLHRRYGRIATTVGGIIFIILGFISL